MLKIEFKVGNAAFREEDEDGNDRLCADAVADTVDELAGKIREGFTSGPVMDANGNTVVATLMLTSRAYVRTR